MHKIIIMIEMGDLSEGVMGEELIEFYGKILSLPIEIRGIGNKPQLFEWHNATQDKLIQLSLYKQ
jgi:predicted amino acid racemase